MHMNKSNFIVLVIYNIQLIKILIWTFPLPFQPISFFASVSIEKDAPPSPQLYNEPKDCSLRVKHFLENLIISNFHLPVPPV